MAHWLLGFLAGWSGNALKLSGLYIKSGKVGGCAVRRRLLFKEWESQEHIV